MSRPLTLRFFYVVARLIQGVAVLKSDADTCFHLCVDLFYFLFEYMLFF